MRYRLLALLLLVAVLTSVWSSVVIWMQGITVQLP